MIKFSELLKDQKPIHRLEQLMLVTDFACGCVTSITYGGRPARYYGKDRKSIDNTMFWHDGGSCICGHECDFSEVKRVCDVVGGVNLVAEIKISNGFDVSAELAEMGQAS